MSLATDLQTFLTAILTPAQYDDIKILVGMDTNAQLTTLHSDIGSSNTKLDTIAARLLSAGGNSVAYILVQIYLALGGEATTVSALLTTVAARLYDTTRTKTAAEILSEIKRRGAVCPEPLTATPDLLDDDDPHDIATMVDGHDYLVTLVNGAVSEGGAISNIVMAWYGCQADEFTLVAGREGLLQPYQPVIVSPRGGSALTHLYVKRHVDTPYCYRVICCRADT